MKAHRVSIWQSPNWLLSPKVAKSVVLNDKVPAFITLSMVIHQQFSMAFHFKRDLIFCWKWKLKTSFSLASVYTVCRSETNFHSPILRSNLFAAKIADTAFNSKNKNSGNVITKQWKMTLPPLKPFHFLRKMLLRIILLYWYGSCF